MSYKKSTVKMLAGSISLVPPVDLINPPDALKLENFRTDQAGSIRSRAGSAAAGTAGGTVRSLIKALGLRYQGSTSLYRSFASVASGFSGEPMGLVDFKKRLWAMDQSKQVKDDGTNNNNWSITAPASKCTAGTGTEYKKTVDDFEATWLLDGVAIPTGDGSYDGSVKQDGVSSLKIAATDEKQYILTKTSSLDLSSYSGHTADQSDKHRIWVYCSKFKKLEQLVIELDCDAGDFKTDYYTVTIPRKKLKKYGKGWAHIEIRRTESDDVDDTTPFFTRFGGKANKNWSTIAALRIVVDTRAACDVRLDLWEVFGSVDGLIEGEDIQYYYTYVNTYGDESNPSPVSDVAAINHTSVSITGLTASADAQVTGKHLYRTSTKLEGKVYRVTTTAIANATTTYTDTSSDETLTALGIQMETDNDAPPAAQGLIGPYFGRLIAFNTSSNKNRFFWTKLNKPYAFPGAALDTGNWSDVGDSGEGILAATQRPRFILFYKENTIWRLVGDPDDIAGEVEITNSNYGVVGRQAVAQAGEVDYFVANEGIFVFNGDQAVKISGKIDALFKGQTITFATGITWLPVSSSNRDKCVLEYVNGRLYFSYPDSGNSVPNKTLILNTETGNWYSNDRGYNALYYEGQNGAFLGAYSNAGAVHTLETGTQDAGSNITVDYWSGYYDSGAPDTRKTFEDFTMDIDTAGQTLTVTAYLDNGTTTVALGTVNTNSRARRVFQFDSGDGVQGYNCSIRISGATNGQINIYDLVLNYYFEAREGKSFDTDEQDFGTVKMKKIREVQIDLENLANTATLKLFTDQPGTAMSQRGTDKTIAIATTRRKEHIVFASDYIGHLVRMYLSGSAFSVYGMRALIQAYGTYLLGAKGEFYYSNVIDFNTERVKLIKEIEIVYSMPSGTASFVVQSDLPGGDLATRDTNTTDLVVSSDERTAKLRYPGTLKGRLFTFKLTPTADFILEGIRCWVKTIGEPNASPWMWLELPVEKTEDAIWHDVPIPPDEIG